MSQHDDSDHQGGKQRSETGVRDQHDGGAARASVGNRSGQPGALHGEQGSNYGGLTSPVGQGGTGLQSSTDGADRQSELRQDGDLPGSKSAGDKFGNPGSGDGARQHEK